MATWGECDLSVCEIVLRPQLLLTSSASDRRGMLSSLSHSREHTTRRGPSQQMHNDTRSGESMAPDVVRDQGNSTPLASRKLQRPVPSVENAHPRNPARISLAYSGSSRSSGERRDISRVRASTASIVMRAASTQFVRRISFRCPLEVDDHGLEPAIREVFLELGLGGLLERAVDVSAVPVVVDQQGDDAPDGFARSAQSRLV